MSLPGWSLSFWISVVTSSWMSVELVHAASRNVVEATNFWVSFMRWAIGSSAGMVGQKAANPSKVFRPRSIASVDSM